MMYLPPGQQGILAEIAALKKEELNANLKKEVIEVGKGGPEAASGATSSVAQPYESAEKKREGSQDESSLMEQSNLGSHQVSVHLPEAAAKAAIPVSSEGEEPTSGGDQEVKKGEG